MKKMIKNTIIFTSVLILSLMTSVIFLGSRVKAADLGDGSFSVEYTTSKMNEHYGNQNNIPTYEDGYLFAGWYEDEECTISYVKEGGETLEKYYAKFVPQDVLSVKVQHENVLHNVVLKDGSTEEGESTGRIRFVTSTDSANYIKVGLHVETFGANTLKEDYIVNTLYEKLYAVGTTDDKSDARTADEVFGLSSSEYFAPYSFKIRFTQFDYDFEVTPYWVTPDGVRVDGVTRTRNMIENLEDNSYAEVNGRAYYTSNDFSTVYTAAQGESSFLGTADSPTVMTLLKDNMPVTSAITIGGNLRYLTIQNKANVDTTISRGTDFTGNMFEVNNGAQLQLGIANSEEEGQLIIDGARIADSENIAVGTRTVYLKGAQSVFILQKNATLQNANSTASGAAIANKGTCLLFGNMMNNTSSATGSSSVYAAGAILQCQGSVSLTIRGGTYSGNKNTGTYGAGGVIGTQVENSSTGAIAGEIIISGGSFTGNSAKYGGVIASYTTNKVTISGGEFTSNGTQKNEADEVISACTQGGVVYLFKGATLDITGGEFNSNQADTYGGVISTLNQVGEISITGGKFTSNYAGTYGGVVSIARRGVLNIGGGSFSGNSAGSYGGVISTTQGNTTSNGATINITNGEFTANAGTPDGGVVYVNKSGKLTIGGGTFSGNSATTQGGVISTAEGFNTDTDTETITALPISVTINSGTFSSNSATTDGGVVLINKYASLTVNNGTFNENTGTTYGAVISTIDGSTSDNAPKITINNGTFTSNEGTYGGVVFVDKYVTLDVVDGLFASNSAKNGGVIGSVTGTSATLRAVVNITDGEFSSNTASQSGGVVHMGKYGELTINGGEFTGNSNTSTDATYGGGVIAVVPFTTTTINGGTFSSNTANYGGVVFTPSSNNSSATSGADVTITNGSFTNNSAKMGGVAYLNYAGTLIATGGTFNQNAATTYGGGVLYVLNAEATLSNVTMTGNCTSASNAAYYGGGAITLYRDATVTISNCSIYGNTHAGALSDSEKNTDGCDIAFGGGNNAQRVQKLVVLDDSFNGIIGHVSRTALAKHQVQFSDEIVKTLEKYNTRYTINYDEQTLEEVSAHSIILTSDMHYTTNLTQTQYNLLYFLKGANASSVSGPMLGYSQDERMEIILSDINDYAAKKGFLDAVLFLGDLSIDNKGYANLQEDYLKTFKDNYLSQLNYPWYAIAGNHDSYTADEWETYMGMKRQYSVEIGNAVFIMLDTFEAVHATSGTGSSYVGIDTDFLQTELAKEEYADKIIFLCAHYYHEGKDTTNDAALQAILEAEKADKNRIVCLFRGHSHNSRIITNQTSMAGIPIVDIGGYAYNPDGVDGDYNVFQEAYAWGYQVLEWDENEVRLYHVKPARTYTDSTTTYNYAGATESELTIPLK